MRAGDKMLVVNGVPCTECTSCGERSNGQSGPFTVGAEKLTGCLAGTDISGQGRAVPTDGVDFGGALGTASTGYPRGVQLTVVRLAPKSSTSV